MKRLKKILIWMGIITGAAIGILLILNAWYVWSTGTRLEKQLAVLRESGQPVQLADLARKPIANETNAAVFLRRAADDLDAMQKELMAWYPKTVYPSGTLLPADQEKLEKMFAAYPKTLPLLEQAASCPDYDPQLDFTLPPSSFLGSQIERLGKHRVLYRVLQARSAWLVSAGRHDEAIATTIMLLRLSRHLHREPLIIGYLVTVGCKGVAMDEVNHVLQSGPVSPASRQALDAELALHDNMDGYRWAFLSERAYVLSSLRELPGYNIWLLRGSANDGTLRLLKLMDQYLTNASRLYAEVLAEEDATATVPTGSWNMYRVVIELLKPALNAAREPAERIRSLARSLRVLNALQAGASHGDRMPELADLGLAEDITQDPFNGQPLKFKKLPDGWTVYSVGRNLVDDGGNLDGQTDVGVGPIRPESN